MRRRYFCQVTGVALGAAQFPARAAATLRPVIPLGLVGSFAENWLNQGPLLQTIEYSLSFLGRKSSRRDYPACGLTHAQVTDCLRFFRQQLVISSSALEFELRVWHYFDFYQSVGKTGTGDVLFTGYYEPVFTGSLTPTERFLYPLYRLPPDLVLDSRGTCLGRRTATGLTPYPTRQEIEETQLLKGLELVWLENSFDAYLVQIQGSARIVLEDGRLLGVGYAGKTDRPYQSLGKALIQQGRLQPGEVTLPVLRRYFQAYPEELRSSLYVNQSYVFFKETSLTGPGPTGSIGVPLIAMHAIATDRKLFPRGALALVDVPVPLLGLPETRTLSRFVCNQDTGGAITGPGRVDLFIGSGPEAEDIAGRMKNLGSLYFPILKPNPSPFNPDARPMRPSSIPETF
ncbi:murein transglycosylase A [Candidatus Cyanaurora vandensis]|uniref:murein transglycosylase A n=1 Tax=Candidatus Cyanaurora vandensis TaxID=2714958 RepID=UPI00257FD329|nr:MltA domain-containing protein [Candidatus Cyanaurora vandensis]